MNRGIDLAFISCFVQLHLLVTQLLWVGGGSMLMRWGLDVHRALIQGQLATQSLPELPVPAVGTGNPPVFL